VSYYWTEGSIGWVSAFADLGLREVVLVPGYGRKTQLVLTKEKVAEFFILSTQLQLCLNLNRCTVYTSWNNSDLIKQTDKEWRLGAKQKTCIKFAAEMKDLQIHVQRNQKRSQKFW